MHSILGLLNVLSSHRDIVGANEYHSYRKCIFEPGERKPFSVVYSYLVLSMLFNFHTSEETVYKAPDAARAFTNPYTSCILCSSWYKILALHIVISELEPPNSSFLSFYDHHGLHTERMRCPQYLSLLGGYNELKEGLIFSPGVNLCDIIQHSAQGAKGPEILLPLLHKVLKHLRRKEGE